MRPPPSHPDDAASCGGSRLLAGLRRLDDGLAAVERVLAVLLSAALILSMAGAVAARHLVGIPTQHLLEAGPLLVLWLALVGASLALQRGRHIRLELAMRLMPPALQRVARVATNAFGSALMGFLAFQAVDFVRAEIDLFGLRGWAAVVFPFFFAAAALRFGVHTSAACWDRPERPR